MKENQKRLVLRNMAGGLSEIRGKSADNPVSLLGEGLDWVIVDEAARLSRPSGRAFAPADEELEVICKGLES